MFIKMIRHASVGLVFLLALGLAACGGGKAPSSNKPAPGKTDAYWTAYTKADAAVKERADDAILISSGSQDSTLTSNPQVWAFVYLSPSTKAAWRVSVSKGKVLGPTNIGTSPVKLDVDSAISEKDVEVSPIEAIGLARAKAKAEAKTKGEVPPNVIVGGIFVKVEGAAANMLEQGVWNVTFVDKAGANPVAYNVNMKSGVAVPAK